MAIARLTLSSFTGRKARVTLTVLAIALSVSLVIAVTSGYTSAEASIYKYMTEFMGSTDVKMFHSGEKREGISESIVDRLRTDPDVFSAAGRYETEARLVDKDGNLVNAADWAVASIIGVDLPRDIDVDNLQMEPGTTGKWFRGDTGNVAVIDQKAAQILKIGVGDTVIIPHPERPLRLKVMGVVHKPAIMAALQQTIYVPLRTLQQYGDSPGKVTRILVDLKPGVDADAWSAKWTPLLKKTDPLILLETARQTRKEMDKVLTGAQMLSYLGGSISMLAALFIIFTTLSMGVTERQRILGMLRAIGALKSQIAAVVIIEGIILALIGVTLGLPLGWVWIKILSTWKADFFVAGAVLSKGGIAFAVGGSIIAAIAASLLPAWNATKVDPISALTVAGQTPARSIPLMAAFFGLLLICIDPLLIHIRAVPQAVAFWGHFFVGLPTLMLGYFLLAPATVHLTETILGPVAAALMGVRRSLVSHQLTGHIWRAAGTAAALMVGLAILVVMHVQSNSVLNGWKIPDKFPDLFVFAPTGLSPDKLKLIESVEGVKPGEVLPIAISGAGVGSIFSVAGAEMMPDSTTFLGVDPDKALAMLHLDFTAGNPKDAAELLKKGRHILVTEEFRVLKNYTVGSKIILKTPVNGDVEYTIAGVVWSPGIDMFVAMFDMSRQFQQRSAGNVFGSLEDVKNDFGVQKISLFAVNLNNYVERADIEARVKKKLGFWDSAGFIYGDVRQIRTRIVGGFRKLVLLLSTFAMAAIAVASLGVTNTILASIRSRQWQIGILRSIGLTRSQLIRTILAEAILLGLVACILGVAAGLELSLNAHGETVRFIGYDPPIDIPWDTVGLGCLIVLSVAILASLFPAISAARQQPLDLLQAGRAAG